MKRLYTTASLLFIFISSYSQIAHDLMIGGGFDLIKTDVSGFLGKAQIGTELNYFLNRKFTGSGGFEAWTGDNISFVIGGRYYPMDVFFVRARGLIGENDLSLGTGWCKPLSDNVRFEAIGDFYFRMDFSVRIGVAYVFRRN